jgi:hypothetical protein
MSKYSQRNKANINKKNKQPKATKDIQNQTEKKARQKKKA